MKSGIFSVLGLVAVQLMERGIPRSWPDAIALLVVVLRAWAERARPAIAARRRRGLGPAQRASTAPHDARGALIRRR